MLQRTQRFLQDTSSAAISITLPITHLRPVTGLNGPITPRRINRLSLLYTRTYARNDTLTLWHFGTLIAFCFAGLVLWNLG
jgi:hypothetical protein